MNHLLPELRRAVVAALLVFLVSATAWSAGQPHQKTVANVVLQVHGSEFKFVPNALNVVKGQKVTIIFTNDGVLAHNFVIEGLGPKSLKTPTIQSHETAKLSFSADKAGAFRFRCLVPGHMEAGMHGVLTVSN